MTDYQIYSAQGSTRRILITVKGPTFVRFGVCRVRQIPLVREVAPC